MRPRRSALAGALLVFAITGPAVDTASAQGPIFLEVIADQDYTSSDPLVPFNIQFMLHANGQVIQGLQIPFELNFTNDNIMGSMDEFPNGQTQLVWSSLSQSIFNSRGLNVLWGYNPTNPDTMLVFATSFGPPWKGSGLLFHLLIQPSDTGSISFDTLTQYITPELRFVEAYDPFGGLIPISVYRSSIQIPPQPGDVRLRVTTHNGTDTIFFGNLATIRVSMDAAGHELTGAAMVFRWTFTNGNIMGPISQGAGEVTFSDAALDAFESVSWNGLNGSSTDTSLVGLIDFNGQGWSTKDVAWSVTFTPLDTGTIIIHSGADFTVPPVYCGSSATDSAADTIPIHWIPVRIPVVPCPYSLMGDVNQDAQLTSSDLIYFINYLFKSGPAPLPDRSIGDVNCSGGLTGGDIIVLVNHIFKGGAPPCACIVRRI